MPDLIKKIEKVMRAFIPAATPYIDIEKKLKTWEKFCDENNGTLQIKRTGSNTFSRLIMEVPIKNYMVRFEESDLNLLRVTCNLGIKDFRFYITFEDVIEKIIKSFYNQEIEIGDTEFDDKYLITTNNERKMKNILSDSDLKNLLLKNNVSNFHLANGELFILGDRHIDDAKEFEIIFEIFKNLISKVCR
ncbi:hypothetical protein [Marinifilum fragile]|uniref:hypothetical protein n=1 Tax=Marinifilum fragile TaxID=570161 RepID=UPI002AA69628|nr:hypothetical protein [Marinifilum fragile]